MVGEVEFIPGTDDEVIAGLERTSRGLPPRREQNVGGGTGGSVTSGGRKQGERQEGDNVASDWEGADEGPLRRGQGHSQGTHGERIGEYEGGDGQLEMSSAPSSSPEGRASRIAQAQAQGKAGSPSLGSTGGSPGRTVSRNPLLSAPSSDGPGDGDVV